MINSKIVCVFFGIDNTFPESVNALISAPYLINISQICFQFQLSLTQLQQLAKKESVLKMSEEKEKKKSTLVCPALAA